MEGENDDREERREILSDRIARLAGMIALATDCKKTMRKELSALERTATKTNAGDTENQASSSPGKKR